jgi:hypothetical protein
MHRRQTVCWNDNNVSAARMEYAPTISHPASPEDDLAIG